MFAASGEWLARCLGTARPRAKAAEDDAPYFAFGLLAFYYLCAVGRLGGYVLQMPPTLYALPAMLAAFAAVRVADGLKASGRSEPSGRRSLRLAGYGLSALAFALGLARPEVRLPLYSGNTLAAALVGLALYGRALRPERRPAFLYAGFAALFLAYFGAHDFVKDFLAGVRGADRPRARLRRQAAAAVQGPQRPGLQRGSSPGSRVFFARRWKDDRLAWHCHLIGLPLSIAACVLSAFEPLAAVLTMGGYAVAYGVATWLFAAPWVAYLACAAFAGAAVAGTSYLGDLAAGARSLAPGGGRAGPLGGRAGALAIERVPPAYRVPVVRSARVRRGAGPGARGRAAWPSDPPTWTAAAAGWVLAVLYLLIGLETPLASGGACAAGACAAVAALLTIRAGVGPAGWPVDRAWLGAWAAAVGLALPGGRPLAPGRRRPPGGPARSAEPAARSIRSRCSSSAWSWPGWRPGSPGRTSPSRLPTPTTRDLVAIAATMALVAARAGDRLGLERAARSGSPILAVLAGAAAAIAGIDRPGVVTRLAASPDCWPWPRRALGLVLVGLGDRIRGGPRGWLAALSAAAPGRRRSWRWP